MYRILYLPTAVEPTKSKFKTKEAALAWIDWMCRLHWKKKHLFEVVEVKDANNN